VYKEQTTSFVKKMSSSGTSKVKEKTKLPYMQVACSMIVQFSEAMNINVLFPFLAFMVESFGYGGPELGYYAGGLGTQH